MIKGYKISATPLASSEASVFAVTSRDGATGLTTTLTTGVYVVVDLADMATPSVNFISGITHLGNGRFEVPSAGSYDFSPNFSCYHSATGSIGCDFTYGVWNGSAYVAVTAAEVSETLANAANAASTANIYKQLLFSGISRSANDRIALMAKRTSGSGNLVMRQSDFSIAKG